MAKWLASTVLIAVAYYSAGRLGQLLAVPPNYATAIFPASGIALAGLLLLGYRAAIGVYFGALAVNAWSPVSHAIAAAGSNSEAVASGFSALLQPALVSLGPTMQAVVGALLIRLVIGFPNPLIRERDILWFLALGGPISCLIGATWGVSVLYLSPNYESASVFLGWLHWWVGDVIGVIFVAPVVLVFFGQPQSMWKSRRISVAIPMTIVLAVASASYVFLQYSEQTQTRLRFDRRVDQIFQDIQEQVTGHLNAVNSLKSYYAGSENVDRVEFRIFNQLLLPRHRGVHAMEWLPRVAHADRAKYEARAREEGLLDFEFREADAEGQLVQAEDREHYFPVYFVEPLASNQNALGFDVGSHPKRRAALELARDTGRQIATSPIALVQDLDGQPGFLVVDPIYATNANKTTSTVAERRRSLQGFVLGVFRVSDIVAASSSDGPIRDYVLKMVDVDAAPSKQVIYTENSRPSSHKENEVAAPLIPSLPAVRTLDVAGRTWQLRFGPTPDFFSAELTSNHWLLLTAGLCFAGLLGAFLLILAGRTAHVEEIVANRTGELSKTNASLAQEVVQRKQFEDALRQTHETLERRVEERTAELKASESRYLDLYNNAPDMFVSVDVATQRVIECNETLLSMTGFSKSEVIDRHVFDLYAPECLEKARRAFGRFLAEGRVRDLELKLRRADGGVVDVSLNVSAIRDEEGRLLYSRAVLRDISAKKEAEKRIRSQENELAHVARLSMMGELATGLAHEINQPLAAIAAYAEGAAMRIRGDKIDGERLVQVVERISADAHRAGEVVRRLRRFVHKREPDRSQIDVNELVADVVQFVATDVRRRDVTIGFDLEKDLPPLMCDSIAIQQVLLNLILNGCDAMEKNSPAERQLFVRTFSGDERTVEVAIEDRGLGFSEQQAEQVFEAFFTSKEDGLGMGLAISRSIIESHGGRIWATSNTGRGATFHFSLPVAEELVIDE